MTARTVTGNTILLTGSAQAGQTVTAVKRYATINGTVITQASTPATDTTDASGNFSFALDAPADGSTAWTLVCPDGSEFDFNLTLGDGSDVAVTTLIGAAATDADAVVLLLDSYVLRSGATMTGALAFSGTTHGGVKLLSLTTTQRDALTPANGMVIYNSTTGAVNAYQNGAWGALGGGSSAWGGITGTLADQTDLQTALNAKADDTDIGTTIQAYSAKTAAIAALTWAANSIILLTGTATAAVQALAAHVVTFLQSASAADARSAIGAGTGNGDLLAANNLSELTATAPTARTNLGLGTLATQSGTFSGGGTLATGGFTLTVPATGTAALRAASNTFTSFQTISTVGGLTPLILVATNSLSSSVHAALQINNTVGGTPVAGFGQSIDFTVKSSTSYGTPFARLVNVWNVATHASRVPDTVFYLTDYTAEREIWRGRATGSAAAIGFLGATPVVRAAHIADPSGGATTDAEARTAINAILVVLENLGFNATS